MAHHEEAKIAERQRHFIGSAKVHLKHLNFDIHDPQQSTSLTLDAKNIDRLTQVFRLEGCLRLDLEHHIPAIISKQTLQESLRHSKVDSTELHRRQSPPTLLFPENTHLPCLHGKHRIAAARTILLPGNTWWTVDLYLDDLSETVRRDIREEYANSRNFCDGDIFQQLRYCQKSLDHQGEGRWLARLSEAKRKDLKQLQRRIELRPLVEALDDLLPFVGFWPSLQIGMFHRLLNLKCPEELQRYLVHVHWCWDHILNEDKSLRPLVDVGTVRLLETLNPSASRRDENSIEYWMGQGMLFPRVTDPNVRARILYRLGKLDRMIPSLHTFLEDTKWLEPCAKIVRSLLPLGCRDPTRESIFKMYNGSNVLRVQDSSMAFTEYEGSEVGNVEYGYRQLWLFAWRHFPELSGMMPRKDKGEPKPQAKISNEQCRYQFAQLASALGFESSLVTTFLERDPDKVMALEFLREARPEEFFRLPENIRLAIAGRICEVLPSSGENAITSERSGTMTDIIIPTDHRCGRPYEQSHSYSKSYFFLEDIHAERTQTLSYYTVNRDIFLAFFGTVPPWKPSNDDGMYHDSGLQVNPQDDSGDRMDAETTVVPDHNSLLSTNVAPISLPQSRSLDIDMLAPVQPVGPIITSDGRKGAETTVSQHSDLSVANSEAPALVPESRSLNTNSNALVTVAVTRERGEEQYPAQGAEPVGQIEAASEMRDIDETEPPNLNTQLVPREAFKARDEEPSLHDIWKTQCRAGHKFFVQAFTLNWNNLPKGQIMPVSWMDMFNTCHVSAWSSSRESLRSLRYEQLDRYARSLTADGIFYLDEKKGGSPDRLRVIITGKTTKERLRQLEEDSIL